MPTPPREIHADADLVRALLEEQHPDLASLPIRGPFEGWDNLTFRLGDELAARLPRRALSVDLTVREQQWLPRLPSLPLATPGIVRTGRPSATFPHPWSIVGWIDGQPADRTPPAAAEAATMAAFLAALHQPAPTDAPDNPFRSRPLGTRSERFTTRLGGARVARFGFDPDHIARLRDEAAAVPVDAATSWIHGDLHPKNIVVDSGRIAGVIDWGDVTPGDPATDLSVVWSLFDPGDHHLFWQAYAPVSAATQRRAVGWAIEFSVLWIVDAGDVDGFVEMGVQTLRRVTTEQLG